MITDRIVIAPAAATVEAFCDDCPCSLPTIEATTETLDVLTACTADVTRRLAEHVGLFRHSGRVRLTTRGQVHESRVAYRRE